MRVVFAGDSYVSKFKAALDTRGNNFPNDLDMAHVEVTYKGKAGGRISTLRSLDMMRQIAEPRPHVILLQVGGNDVSTTERNGVLIANRLMTLAQELQNYADPEYIYICGLTYRERSHHIPTRAARIHYNQQVDEVNKNLARLARGQHRVKFWKHKGLKNPTSPVIHHDGTHLNILGLIKYRLSIRGAILHAHNDFSNV